MWKKSLTTAALVAVANTASAAAISALSDEEGQAIYWGLTNTPTYGQTVTLEDAAVLHGFKFTVDDNGAPVGFEIQVYAWDDNGSTGPALYTGSGQTGGVPGFTTYVLDLGGLSLDAGRYVLLLEATSEGAVAFATSEGVYNGGSWVYQEEAWYVDERIDLSFELTYESAGL